MAFLMSVILYRFCQTGCSEPSIHCLMSKNDSVDILDASVVFRIKLYRHLLLFLSIAVSLVDAEGLQEKDRPIVLILPSQKSTFHCSPVAVAHSHQSNFSTTYNSALCELKLFIAFLLCPILLHIL